MQLHQRAAKAYQDGDHATFLPYKELKALAKHPEHKELIAKVSRDMSYSYFLGER